MRKAPDKIVVVGLGYVGLPLAVALAKAHRGTEFVGFDINAERIAELERGHDRTREVDSASLAQPNLSYAGDDGACGGADLIIVTVPTPVDDNNHPDLGPLLSATRRLAGWIDPVRRPTIVYESTVYPGATEEECGPLIGQVAGLTRARDFRLGYSPERINPGDTVHRVDLITKVIAGEDDEVLDQLDHLYGTMTAGGVFRAASIRAAEAAKAIENAQRDINIAFMNEIAQILHKLDVSVYDVLDAARTKWNFLGFEPGLVGGHCIGVDPYYLSHVARKIGHDPKVILSGRDINDNMGPWIAERLHDAQAERPGRVLFMGITFKEDVPDVRNSRAIDVVRRLKRLGHDVTVIDPLADAGEVRHEYGIELSDGPEGRYDTVVGAVAHRSYREMDGEKITALLNSDGLVADIKGMWRDHELSPGIRRWSL